MSYKLCSPPRSQRRSHCGHVIEFLEPRQLLAAADLDSLFGTGGYTHPTFLPDQNSGQYPGDMILLGNGSMLVAGGASTNFGVAKFNADGDPDIAFGTNGSTTIEMSTQYNDVAQCIALQSDGKILLAGSVRHPTIDMAITRLLPNGTLDTSFGTDGRTFVDFGNTTDRCQDMLVQPADDGIVLVGYADNGNRARGAVTRLDANGQIDTTFGTNGRSIIDLTPDFGGIGGDWSGVCIQPDGKIVTTGGAGYDYNWGVSKAVSGRFNTNGQLDPTFGNAGLAYTTASAYALDIKPVPGGGFYTLIGAGGLGILKLTPTGQLDTTWGNGGASDFVTMSSTSGSGHLALGPDGSIWGTRGISSGVTIARFTPTGLLDPSFNGTGSLTKTFGSQLHDGSPIAVQPDGRVIVCGSANYPNYDFSGWIVQRYMGQPDAPPGVSLINRAITITGSSAADTLAISSDDDSVLIDFNGQPFDFPGYEIGRLDIRALGGDDAITLGSMTPLGAIDGGAGADTIQFNGPSPDVIGRSRKLVGGDGNDTLVIQTLDPFTTFDGAAGTDTIVVQGTAGADSFDVATGKIIGHTANGDPAVSFVNVEAARVDAGDGEDVVNINTTSNVAFTVNGEGGNDSFTATSARSVTVSGGDGDDEFVATRTDNTNLRMVGDAGTNTFTFHDGDEGNSIVVDPGQISSTIGITLRFTQMASLNVLMEGGGDTLNIHSAPAGSTPIVARFDSGAGDDALSIGNSAITGTVGFAIDAGDGADSIYLDGQPAAAASYFISNDEVKRTTQTSTLSLALAHLERMTMWVGPATDIVQIGATNGLTRFSLDDAGGNDQISFLPTLTADQWAAQIDVDAGNGNDTLTFDAPVGAPMTVRGQGGADTLNYHASDTLDDTFTIFPTAFSAAPNPAVITHDTFEDVLLYGRGGNDQANFDGTGPSNPLASNTTFVGGDGDDVLRIANANGPVAHMAGGPGADALDVLSGAAVLLRDLGANESQIDITVRTGSSLRTDVTQHVPGRLTIEDGALASILVGGSRVLVARELALSSTSKLDLNDNDLIIDYASASPAAAIQSMINTARAGGAWTGNGITSTNAKLANPKNTTLGLMEATEYQSIYGPAAPFAGETIDTTAVLVKYTYYGDADFNGQVNFDDYSRLDNGFSTNKTGWINGDFDSNGLINFDDFSLIDLAFNTQGTALSGPANRPRPRGLDRS